LFTIYGLPSCDTCRKARRYFGDQGRDAAFVDLRESPLSREILADWLERLGPGLLNTRSTTWRGLDAAERARDPLDLLQAHPALIKRPVIAGPDGHLSMGWDAKVEAALAG